MQLVWFGLSSVANGHFVSAIIRMITVLIEMMIVVADESLPQWNEATIETHTHTYANTCTLYMYHPKSTWFTIMSVA